MKGRAYFRSDVVEVYVEGRMAWDVEEVARAVGRGEVAVGVFTFDFSPWEGIAVRGREVAEGPLRGWETHLAGLLKAGALPRGALGRLGGLSWGSGGG